MGEFLRGAGRSLGIVAGFVAFTLGCNALERLAGAGGAAGWTPYACAPMASTSPSDPPDLWLVDGFNVLNVALLRGGERRAFWRAPARSALIDLAAALGGAGSEVVVVFDGDRVMPLGETEPGPRIVFAASADDWLLAAVRHAPDPSRLAVVTADRRLAARAGRRGARIVAPGAFVERCRAQRPGESS